MSGPPFSDNRLVWTRRHLHRLTGPQFSISVLEDDPAVFDTSVDVEVTMDGRRYSATFFTPGQVRECLDVGAVFQSPTR